MGSFTFGIMGAGKIAKKFCAAVELVDGCKVTAVMRKQTVILTLSWAAALLTILRFMPMKSLHT